MITHQMTTLGLGRHEAAEILEQRARHAKGGGMGNGRGFWHSVTDNKLLAAIVFAGLVAGATWLVDVNEAKRSVVIHAGQLSDHERRIRSTEDQILVDGEWKRNTDRKLDEILDEVRGKRPRR